MNCDAVETGFTCQGGSGSSVDVCGPCYSSCTSCSGSSSSDCTMCAPNTPFQSNWTSVGTGSCVSDCVPLGMWGDDGTTPSVCAACHPSCQTCSGANASQCLSCHPSSLVPFLHEGTCVSACPSAGFFALTQAQCVIMLAYGSMLAISATSARALGAPSSSLANLSACTFIAVASFQYLTFRGIYLENPADLVLSAAVVIGSCVLAIIVALSAYLEWYSADLPHVQGEVKELGHCRWPPRGGSNRGAGGVCPSQRSERHVKYALERVMTGNPVLSHSSRLWIEEWQRQLLTSGSTSHRWISRR